MLWLHFGVPIAVVGTSTITPVAYRRHPGQSTAGASLTVACDPEPEFSPKSTSSTCPAPRAVPCGTRDMLLVLINGTGAILI